MRCWRRADSPSTPQTTRCLRCPTDGLPTSPESDVSSPTSGSPTHALFRGACRWHAVHRSRRHAGRRVAGVHPNKTDARLTTHQLGRHMREPPLSLGSIRPAWTVLAEVPVVAKSPDHRRHLASAGRAEPAVEPVGGTHRTWGDAGGPRCVIGYGPNTLKSAI